MAYRLNAAAAKDDVRAVSADQDIRARPARKHVKRPVVASDKHIIAGAAGERILSSASVQVVVASGGDKYIPPAKAKQLLVAGAVVQIVVEVVAQEASAAVGVYLAESADRRHLERALSARVDHCVRLVVVRRRRARAGVRGRRKHGGRESARQVDSEVPISELLHQDHVPVAVDA